MYEKDYIMRQIQEFFNALRKILRLIDESKTKIEDINIQLNELYVKYFEKEKDFFYTNSVDTIISYFDNNIKSLDTINKIKMLSELMYYSIIIEKTDNKIDLLKKVLQFYEYIENCSNSFSIEQNNRIKKIMELINKFQN